MIADRMTAPRSGIPVPRWSLILSVGLLSASTPPAAATTSHQDAQIASCIARASVGRAWLGPWLWGLRDQEGGWIGAEVANRDGSVDLGPMQVNSRWLPALSKRSGRTYKAVRAALRDNACFNIDVAAWIFLTAYRDGHDPWRAVGRYHSPTDWRQRRYARSVAAHLKARFGATLAATGSSQDTYGSLGVRNAPAAMLGVAPSIGFDRRSPVIRIYGFGRVSTASRPPDLLDEHSLGIDGLLEG